ncbi:C1 family peptidase [Solitalea canadensis]|uniref:Cysteine protease n=1 Tax=Solitalea canadensis (strain ATCC 29591 / DSM 3403 / JCM 21819 / LMG 8368 / NBRC 15130 / NCIMB 12057 / USAM 9D) TaxID=929556 RepID=H8KUH2_SOLCM|nr:C1 family peptidase [Solitalea canadensis]AFD07337.1 cysteine protease [Solitalea canadensis DSM 3403]
MAQLKIKALVSDLAKTQARWQASETEVSKLPENQQRALLGVEIDPAALQAIMAVPPKATTPSFAPAVDWRNRNGNHVTSVKDQGGCGSCVSFCITSVVESMTSIEKGQLLNLSEADLHFCSNHGANCGGWWPQYALDEVKARGIVDDVSFPYASAFPNNDIWQSPPHCTNVTDRASNAVKITSYTALVSEIDRKNHLTNIGPCSAVIEVYQDFFSYTNGVYHHVSGGLAGLHCVSVIGYSEAEQCWICKNSWNTAWGNAGFFKIAYGQCGIDTTYPFYGAQGVVLPAQKGWQGWESLGGGITSKPDAVSWDNNRIDVVARGLDSAVWHRWWNGTAWFGWESLGGGIQGAPSICSWANGRLDIFAVGLNHHLYHKWYQGGWSGWEDLGGLLSSDPSCVSWGNNRIDIFARGTDSALWHKWWDGAWYGWESLGGVLTSAPTVCSWASGRLDIFARGTNNSLFHKWYEGQWSNWEDLNAQLFDNPGAVSWGPNRIDVFFPGQNNHMMHKWWNGQWSGVEDLGGVLSSGVGVSSWAANRLDCFVMGTNSQLYHKWYEG